MYNILLFTVYARHPMLLSSSNCFKSHKSHFFTDTKHLFSLQFYGLSMFTVTVVFEYFKQTKILVILKIYMYIGDMSLEYGKKKKKRIFILGKESSFQERFQSNLYTSNILMICHTSSKTPFFLQQR